MQPDQRKVFLEQEIKKIDVKIKAAQEAMRGRTFGDEDDGARHKLAELEKQLEDLNKRHRIYTIQEEINSLSLRLQQTTRNPHEFTTARKAMETRIKALLEEVRDLKPSTTQKSMVGPSKL